MIVSRIALITASIVVGIVLAVGAAFTASSVLGSPAAPANKQLYNYGSP
jgi:Protein of unknown function (DUF2613)